ncbi:hypothetical protein CEUSTIGMA_g6110.t1 [Chlamydomonas eustigma]|uniref:DUF7796 domain-containing protein n=1 Tax=Chlamydomonas eustigma TaxID=1157962 RepID=A0A250X705_9CHLO|nr:hypothetical protein CEUSTIGMA_g6110.t1 [Chlamydomonas eustigma]|eukprot:GAX78672.1 hypothetical protein CEUSTIGMA_g6110.t1 [Chlamydomonas eustigma]
MLADNTLTSRSQRTESFNAASTEAVAVYTPSKSGRRILYLVSISIAVCALLVWSSALLLNVYPLSSIRSAKDRKMVTSAANAAPGSLQWYPPGRWLVVVMGQLRGGGLVYRSFSHHILDALRADLALLGPPDDSADTLLLQQRAKYKWIHPDPENGDWGPVLTRLANGSDAWKRLCKVTHKETNNSIVIDFLGSAGAPAGSLCWAAGSGIIHYINKRLIQLELEKIHVEKTYDWIVVTRSDYLYLCPIPRLNLNKATIYAPQGEEYGGICDRFAIFSAEIALTVLNVTNHLLSNMDFWIKTWELSIYSDYINPERMLYMYYKTLSPSIQMDKYLHPGFTVRRPDKDPTKYREGEDSKQFSPYGIRVKYSGEYEHAMESCEPWKRFQFNNKDYNKETGLFQVLL